MKNNYGVALDAIKRGKMAAREGWNGKEMFIYLTKGIHDCSQETPDWISGISFDLFEQGNKHDTTILPCISFKTASGEILNGWLASQTDQLAEDWHIFG